MICPASGPDAPAAAGPLRRHGLRQGHRRRADLRRRRPAGGRTVWFAVAGSDNGRAPRRSAAQAPALADPAALLRATVARGRAAARAHAGRACPATGCSQRASRGASRTSPSPCRRPATSQVRITNAGKKYPAPDGQRSPRPAGSAPAGRTTRGCSRTDGEYTGFAAVAAGQFDGDQGPPARAARRQPGRQRHQRQGRARGDARRAGLLRRQRRPRQHRRDREVPEHRGAGVALDRATTGSATRCTTSRSATCGTSSASSTPTTTAGPRGSATSSATGMGEEKLDNTVYTIRGLRDLADLAAQQGRPRHAALGDRHGRRAARGASTAPGGTARPPTSTPTR